MILFSMNRNKFRNATLIATSVCVTSLIFNEFLIYYFAIWQCAWPLLREREENKLKVLVLSDPHLLGQREGHWFDKLRREWQIYRSFQTSVNSLAPDVVFILGDLLDEGKWADADEWETYVNKARRIFKAPDKVPVYTLVGNHDVGFHNEISLHKISRFYKEYGTKHVKLVTIQGITFVLLNSMAFHNDGCGMCSDAEQQLNEVSSFLNCHQREQTPEYCFSVNMDEDIKSSQPILLQHFPLYRESDKLCKEIDSVPKEKLKPFIEKKDCVSEVSSKKILDLLNPRLIMSGHTHNGCHYFHRNDLIEISVPSFSWRNRNNPSFYLVSVSPSDYSMNKCFIPKESTVFIVYGLIPFVTILLVQIYFKRRTRKTFNNKVL